MADDPETVRAPEPGTHVPGFTLELDDGSSLSDGDLRGTPYVLYFYPRDETPGCTREAVDFSALAEEFARLGVRVIGVSPDGPESHRRFRARHELKVELASDPEGRVARAFGAFGTRMRFGRPRTGVVRSTFLVGPDGQILARWRAVKVPGHAERVLAEARKRLGGGDAAA